MATKAEVKERGIRIGINQIVTYATLVPIFWFVAQPLIVNALAEDIKQTVQTEVAPLNSAFVALLRSNIANTRRKIAQLEFRRDNPPANDWSSLDAEELVNLKIDLSSSQAAVAALMADNTS